MSRPPHSTDEHNDDSGNTSRPDLGSALNLKGNSNSLEFWRGLAEIARESELAELEVEQDGVRVTLRAQSAVEADHAPLHYGGAQPVPGVLTAPIAAAVPGNTPGATPSVPKAKAVEENLATVISPMVGMFYRAPSPSDPNFVEVGDKVEVGQTVALVEAMKVFNEITSEVAGVVVEIKANSADLVETGQVLMTIR